jgi:hypothetical protein
MLTERSAADSCCMSVLSSHAPCFLSSSSAYSPRTFRAFSPFTVCLLLASSASPLRLLCASPLLNPLLLPAKSASPLCAGCTPWPCVEAESITLQAALEAVALQTFLSLYEDGT